MAGDDELQAQAETPGLARLFSEEHLGPSGTYYSDAYDVPQAHNDFSLMVDLRTTGSPTSIRLDVQASFDGGQSWYDPGVGFWQDLVYTDAAVGSRLREWLTGGQVPSPKLRLAAVVSGGDLDNYFIGSAWVRTSD